MRGFFSPEQIKSSSRPDGRTYSCASCGLYRQALNPRRGPQGGFKKRILNIGSYPTETDDRENSYWRSGGGRLLSRALEKRGISLEDDCLNMNAINCFPGDATVNDYHLMCCRKRVHAIIKEYQPHLILLHGPQAMRSFITMYWAKSFGTAQEWWGWRIPHQETQAWVCPLPSPGAVVREQKRPELKKTWSDMMSAALDMLETPVTLYKKAEECIEIVPDSRIEVVLERMILEPPPLLFFDYETTGLKPHGKTHQIYCVGVSPHPDKSYVFYMPKRKHEQVLFKRLLVREDIKKGAANMKFEHNWTAEKLGFQPRGWYWDTMQAAHVMDNRQGITSLKFQAFVQLGENSYDTVVEPYLKGKDPKNANSMNRVLEMHALGLDPELLKYCALDALFEHRLGLVQMKQLGMPIPQQGPGLWE